MWTARKLLKGIVIAAFAVPVALAAVLALPVERWRTGRLPVPPLPVVENGPEVDFTDRVWIDTDAACGVTRRADPDDCLALILLARSPEIEIAGISSIFGNAELNQTARVARRLAGRLREDGMRLPDVVRGAEAPETRSTAARSGLRQALAAGPLTILALGPLTNVASALKGRPDLQENVTRIVAVMGRRPGHLFHPSEGSGDGMLFGHGPIFRDLNFDKDRQAATEVLAMGLPMSLIPYDVARGVSLIGTDLDRIARSGAAGSWVASSAREWLDFWQEDIGREGFHPFDLLAGAYGLEPGLFNCASVMAWIGHDERLRNFWFFDPVALQVGLPDERREPPRAETAVTYCPTADGSLHRRLMKWLAGSGAKPVTD